MRRGFPVAAHRSVGAATHHALLEVLERDLVARSWYESGGKGRALDE